MSPAMRCSHLADRRHHRAAARFRRAIQSRPELCAYRTAQNITRRADLPSKDESARGSTRRRAVGGREGRRSLLS